LSLITAIHRNRKSLDGSQLTPMAQTKKSTKQHLCFYFCLLLAAFCFGQSTYIHAKAMLAQVLLAKAWQRAQDLGVAQKPWSWADVKPIAVLTIPSLAIQQYVLDSHAGEALAFGPGMITHDNTFATIRVLAGHRDTHFNFVKSVKPGTVIKLTTLDGITRNFEVREKNILDIRTDTLPLNFMEPTLFLVTCYPFEAITTHGPLRYVLTAHEQVSE